MLEQMVADVLEWRLLVQWTLHPLHQPKQGLIVVAERSLVEVADEIQNTIYSLVHDCVQYHLSCAVAGWQNKLCTLHISCWPLGTMTMSAKAERQSMIRDDWLMARVLCGSYRVHQLRLS
jgi:hypothetical protein